MTALAEKFPRLPTDQLRFDPKNPRLPRSVDAKDEQQVLEWMLQDAGLLELMGSIAVEGFFPVEPLLVMPADEGHGYWVLEGNRRLAAVMLLREPGRAPARKRAVAEIASLVEEPESLGELPCAVFDERNQVLDYLGYRHITGIKQWEPAAKARYLESLYEAHLPASGDDVYRRIARIIGSRADYVMRLLGALRLFETVTNPETGIPGIEEGELSFSLLTLSLNYSAIVRYLGLDSLAQASFKSKLDLEHLTHLATWLYVEHSDVGRTQLGDSRNMKLLAAAVAQESGLAALHRGETVEEAARATVDTGQLLLRSIRTARDQLLAAQSMIHRAAVAPTTMTALEELDDVLAQLTTLARRQLRRREAEDADQPPA